jgi:AraC family transcriptional regulator, ethanolamine operon transcriptional activator
MAVTDGRIKSKAGMQWGFWHLGQFATDYQQLFAEKPSLTLHQRMREWG